MIYSFLILGQPSDAVTASPLLYPAIGVYLSLLKLLLLLKEHTKTDYGTVDQKSTCNRHDHCWDSNKFRVS